MNKQLANSPDAVAPGPNEGAGAGRGSPEEEPQNAPPQAPAAMARLPRSLSNDPKTFPSEEAKPNDFDRTKVGICKLSSTPVQANSTVRRESGESFPYKHAAGAGAAGQAAIPPCKIPALQSTDGDATLNLGKGSLEQNNAKGAWVTLSQSTVVLGTDGNTSVLPGRVEGVRASSPGLSAPGNKGLRDARPSAPARGAVGSRSGMGQELGREGTLPVLSYRAESQPRLRSCGEEWAYGPGCVCPDRNRGQKALRYRSRACPQGIAPGRARRIAGAAPREGSGEPSPAPFAPGGASWGAGSGAVRAPPSQGCRRRFPSLGSSRRRGARQKSLISRADAAAGEGAPGAAPRCSFASVALVRSFSFFLFFLLSPRLGRRCRG